MGVGLTPPLTPAGCLVGGALVANGLTGAFEVVCFMVGVAPVGVAPLAGLEVTSFLFFHHDWSEISLGG